MSFRRLCSSWRIASVAGVLLSFACGAFAQAFTQATHSAHRLRIVNATFDSVVALAFAPMGSGDFDAVAMPRPLQGGMGSTVVDVPPGDCRRDVRVTFRDARAMVYPGLDVCRHDGLRLANGSLAAGRSIVLKEEESAVANSP